MRVLVSFTDPDDGSLRQIELEGPERDVEDLKQDVIAALSIEVGLDIAQELDILIEELPSGTIH
jgi:hypothetical protein